MLSKLMKLHKNQKGITGLETAIILIAFVVVASVFAYTVLSAGLFSTQKSQEAVYSGLKSAQSSMELDGAVIAKADTVTTTDVGSLTFTLTIPAGGSSIDMAAPTTSGSTDGKALNTTGATNSTIITYIDSKQRVENLFWTATFVGKNNGDSLLDSGEKVQVTVGDLTSGAGNGNLKDALGTPLTANGTFTIEIKTASGSVLDFQRTIPATVSTIMSLN